MSTSATGNSAANSPATNAAKARAAQAPPPPPEPLAFPVADSHTHLDMQESPVADALAAAAAVGVTTVIQVGCDLERSRWAAETAAEWKNVWAAVALHPNEAPRLSAEGGEETLDEALAGIEKLAALGHVLAVGESGLDYFRTGPEGVAAQQRSFRAHIELAKRLDKALVIHDREAHADVLRILDEEGAPERTVFHCYSGDAEMAELCAAKGYFMSFAGNVTFKNAQPLRDAVAVAPPELLLVETDAPFLTPAPYRGRPNAPYLIPITLRAMAAAKGMDEERLARHVAANTARAFGY
ncbi:TatD family hydrolase [Streptomyces oryzae]|uniref:TatD family hydrolase n=1 Tax=Streptomyces oryzae TaxID=1434886 RepID=A0ABS3XEF9_9ACTN|nr:TatD family hydrolase [Streptomyces oryzae]MBO8193785.1 TatD family hydrolase [Streptomyces oryzae]